MSWARPLGVFALYKLAVFGLAFTGIVYFANIWPVSIEHFCQLLIEWDAKHILRTAMLGYVQDEPNIQIYPVFPALIWLASWISPTWNMAAVLAAQVASFFAFWFLYRLARLDFSEEQARVAVVLFAIFPTAYFLSVPYMETVYCGASVACVYYLRSRRYAAGAVAGFLAASSRLPGMLLLPALLVYAWDGRARWDRRQWRGLVLVAAGLLGGLFLFLALNRYYYGSWFYYLEHQKKWGVHLSWPFHGAFNAWAQYAGWKMHDRMALSITGTAFACLSLPALWLVARTRDRLDFFYALLSVLLIVCSDFWLSPPRFLLAVYPFYLAAAPWFARGPIRLAGYVFVSGALFAIYFSRYLHAAWAY